MKFNSGRVLGHVYGDGMMSDVCVAFTRQPGADPGIFERGDHINFY